jgi:glucose-1-phosphate thymidylyltransferase
MNLKGVVLAGGLGTRLHPLTLVTNKHLLPVYMKPMIYYPIEMLVRAGVTDIMVVTGGEDAGDFLRLLGNGEIFGLKALHYTYQRGEGGIAAALRLAEHFAAGDRIVVVLGDNIIERNIRSAVAAFRRQKRGARILLKKVPGKPKSSYAVTGIYMYDARVFRIIRTLKPSRRGELEITDVNNAYLGHGELAHSVLQGWWTDAGTFDSLLRANQLVAKTGANR